MSETGSEKPGSKASLTKPSLTPSLPADIDSHQAPDKTCQTQTAGSVIRTGNLYGGEGPVLLTELVDDDDDDAEPTAIDLENTEPKEPPQHEQSKTVTRKEELENTVTDIYDSNDWDTDLEDEMEDEQQASPPDVYKVLCTSHKCTPCSYFLRNITEKEICMKHHGLTRNETRAIVRALKITNIEKLDLEDNWSRKSCCSSFCEVLEENESIQHLNLSQNNLGSSGAICVGNMIKANNSLQTLSLANNGFYDNVALFLAEAIEDSKLRVLDLKKNRFGDRAGHAFGPILATNDYLEVLDLSWNTIRSAGAVSLAKGLKENIRLRSLDLSWNGLAEKGGMVLADMLLVNTTLEELNISSNRLTPAVATRFAKVINTNETLQVLKLSNNPISTSGAVTLIIAVLNSQVTTLKQLDMEGNPVEYEFLKAYKELKAQKPHITVTHGTMLRSGNTKQDLGKPAIDETGPKKPVLLTNESLVINDTRRLEELFAKYFMVSAEKGLCDPEELMECLKILSPGLDKRLLAAAIKGLPKNDQNKINLRKVLQSQSR